MTPEQSRTTSPSRETREEEERGAHQRGEGRLP